MTGNVLLDALLVVVALMLAVTAAGTVWLVVELVRDRRYIRSQAGHDRLVLSRRERREFDRLAASLAASQSGGEPRWTV